MLSQIIEEIKNLIRQREYTKNEIIRRKNGGSIKLKRKVRLIKRGK